MSKNITFIEEEEEIINFDISNDVSSLSSRDLRVLTKFVVKELNNKLLNKQKKEQIDIKETQEYVDSIKSATINKTNLEQLYTHLTNSSIDYKNRNAYLTKINLLILSHYRIEL